MQGFTGLEGNRMRCSACKSDVTPIPPRTMAKLSLVGFYVASLVGAALFSIVPVVNIVLVPVAIAVGWSVGVAARRANAWSCPKCKEEMSAPVGVPATPPTIAERPLVPRTV
jgi:hypothetical protein